MKIILEHGANGDIDGGYWETPKDPCRKEVEIADLKTAPTVFRGWIEYNGLGGGNLTKESGLVFENGKAIARVNYNGRVTFNW